MNLFGKPGHASRRRDKKAGEDYTPQFALPGSNELVSLKEEPWGSIILRWMQSLFLYILLLVVIVATLYSGLAATLLVLSPTGGEDNRLSLVVRNMWQDTGGRPPVGEQAVISTSTPLPEDILSKVAIGWTGIPDPAYVTVASDHMDALKVRGGEVLINDTWQPLASSDAYQIVENGTAETTVQLRDQYLVECLEGSCEPGTYLIVNSEALYGQRETL